MKDKNQSDESKIKIALEYGNNIIATLREPFLVLDKNLRVISTNQAFYTTFEVAEKDTIGRLLPDLGNRQCNIPKLLEMLKEILPEKKVVKDYEVEHKFEHIGERAMILNACQLRVSKEIAATIAAIARGGGEEGGEGEEELILLAIEDITERRRLQEELKDSEQRFRNAFETSEEKLFYFKKAVDSATDAISMSTPEGRHYYQNEAFTKLFGLSVKETDGASGPPGTVYADEKVGRKVFDAIMRGGAFTGEVKMVDKDRNEKDILQRAYSIKDKEGKIIGLVGIHTDFTERKKVEEVIFASEKRYRQLFEESNDAIIIADPQTKAFVDCNKKAQEMSGYSKQELLSMCADQFHPEDMVDGTMEAFKKQAAGMRKIIESEILTKDKKRVAVSINSAILEIDGKPYLMGVFRDITERKQMDEELKRSQDMLIQSEKLASLGKLVSEIAHEVNNPLMIISGNAQLSLISESVSIEVKNSLQTIMDECQRAKNIILRLLKFSRPSKGETKQADINKSIEAIVSILEQQFKLDNIEIKRNYGDDLPTVSIDEQQMQEVFMNLMNNAKEAMTGGGTISITTSLKEDFLRIDFKDTGSGMSEEVKQKIFEPFFTTKEKGTGLGIPVCYGIIKAHDGELKFESELNKGTTATVLLPCRG